MNNKNEMRRSKRAALASLLALTILSACAPAPGDDENDPMESINRGTFEFNQFVDKYAIGPTAKGYRYITPEPIRTRIGNASDNLMEPLNMVNSMLQGDFQRGMKSFWRFVLNTTIGLGGLNDVAASAGIPYQHEDFGQTLAVWGVEDGPYVVLPILGPSSVRDTGGLVTDWLIDPVNYAADTDTSIEIALGQGLVERERLIDVIDDVNNTSLDPYVTMRSMYRQHRTAQITNRGDGPLPTSASDSAKPVAAAAPAPKHRHRKAKPAVAPAADSKQ